MSPLPPALRDALKDALGAEPRNATPLSGGMINNAARVEIDGEPVFVKWSKRAEPGHFTAEADGLRRLQATHTLRVPETIAVGETEAVRFLALEYIEPQPATHPSKQARRLGEQLAALHLSAHLAFGLETDNWIGALPQSNSPHTRWSDFYRDCRLLPMVDIARAKRLLPPAREGLLMRLIEALDNLLTDLPSRPALLHGDLWAGNLLEAGDEPVVVDPAVYCGEREMEIAYMDLFGGFSHVTFDAYRAVYPLDAGYSHRRALHQLYPLLSHLNHFGEQYGPAVERACREYV